MASYKIQGRRTERGIDGTSREIVKLDTAESRTTAFAIAETMSTEKLTAWVFKAERRAGHPPSDKLLGVIEAKQR